MFRKSAASAVSADRSVWGSSASRTLAQADRSNIHVRNLQPTICLGSLQATSENNAVRSLDCLVNADLKAKPRMPGIKPLPKLGTMNYSTQCRRLDGVSEAGRVTATLVST